MSVALGAIVRRLASEGALRNTPVEVAPSAGVEVADVTTDSRLVNPGSLFCAIRGWRGDGHAFLHAAAAAGAAAALVEARDESLDLPQIEVLDGRLGAAFAAAEVFGDPWSELLMVGVTGTNGKTTSVAILRHLLSKRRRTASIGTLGVLDAAGMVVPGTEGLTTPGPSEVAGWLRRLRGDGIDAVAMEVSSHALDQSRVAAVRYDATLFTNLSREHLDYHGSLEAYRGAKLRLVDLLKPGGAAILNADDPAWHGVETRNRVITYGIYADAEIRAESVRPGAGGMEWELRTPDAREPVRLPLYGMYNVSNALGAAATLWSLGWETGAIAAALAGLPQVPGRLERVPTPDGGPTVLIDFAHTPDALERALAAVRPLVSGRVVVVFGAGGERDPGKRPEMGRVAAEGADFTIITSDNPRSEDPAAIADEIEAGMGGARRERVLDRRAAIRRAIELTGPEDAVLLAGKGHETYQIWGAEKRPFDERLVVAEIFAGEGAGS